MDCYLDFKTVSKREWLFAFVLLVIIGFFHPPVLVAMVAWHLLSVWVVLRIEKQWQGLTILATWLSVACLFHLLQGVLW